VAATPPHPQQTRIEEESGVWGCSTVTPIARMGQRRRRPGVRQRRAAGREVAGEYNFNLNIFIYVKKDPSGKEKRTFGHICKINLAGT
jgi:hypothetical protein